MLYVEEGFIKTSKDVFFSGTANSEKEMPHIITRGVWDGSDTIKILRNYSNTKNELAMVQLKLEALTHREDMLKQTKEQLVDYEDHLTEILKMMDQKLNELNGIEYTLYYEIVVRGKNVTKAVDYVSLKYDKDVSTIWKSYYPKVKAMIDELEKNKEDH